MSASEEQVLTMLRTAVAHGPDGSALSVDAATRSGRRRVARRRGLQVVGAAAAASVVVVAVGVLPGLLDRPAPATPGTATTAPQNDVRRLYAAYDTAVSRAGLPVLDTRWTVQPYVRMGQPGEFQDFTGSRSLQNFGTTGSSFDFQTVELEASTAPTTQDELCGAYLANGYGCATSSPAEGLTLLRLLDRPDGSLVGVELWHPTGVVVVSRNPDSVGGPVTDEQLLELAQDPALRW